MKRIYLFLSLFLYTPLIFSEKIMPYMGELSGSIGYAFPKYRSSIPSVVFDEQISIPTITIEYNVTYPRGIAVAINGTFLLDKTNEKSNENFLVSAGSGDSDASDASQISFSQGIMKIGYCYKKHYKKDAILAITASTLFGFYALATDNGNEFATIPLAGRSIAPACFSHTSHLAGLSLNCFARRNAYRFELIGTAAMHLNRDALICAGNDAATSNSIVSTNAIKKGPLLHIACKTSIEYGAYLYGIKMDYEWIHFQGDATTPFLEGAIHHNTVPTYHHFVIGFLMGLKVENI